MKKIFLAFLMFLLPSAAMAACTSPTGVAGDIVYGSNNVMAYCNGTLWQAMGGGNSGTVSSGTQYQMGYYGSTGTVISGTSAVTTGSSGGLVVGSPTGGNEGAGSLNATSVYVNGVAVAGLYSSTTAYSSNTVVIGSDGNY